MTMDPEIRDQAYQFFLEEAPELLQTIETGLLTLRQVRDTATVHSLMRSAHSLKGGAASVGLGAIQAIAHRLETLFKALYSPNLEINRELETQLLQAFDCLRVPLLEQLTQGKFDVEQALATAEPILSQLEVRCRDAIVETENFIPSSSDLGLNMAASIFEVDVLQGLERLAAVLANPQNYEVAGELRAQAEVFLGFGELLNLLGFVSIAQTAIQAIDVYPDRALEITALALEDFRAGRAAVLAGDLLQGGRPSATLSSWAAQGQVELRSSPVDPSFEPENLTDEEMATLLAHLGDDLEVRQTGAELSPVEVDTPLDPEPIAAEPDMADRASVALEDLFGGLNGDLGMALLAFANPQSLQDAVPQVELQAQPQPLQQTQQDHPQPPIAAGLTVRVESNRLARMSNLLGELTINCNSLALQNEQLRSRIRELLHRFEQFQDTVEQIRSAADQMVIAPQRRGATLPTHSQLSGKPFIGAIGRQLDFDALEMDRYTAVYAHTQTLLEEGVQLQEAIEDFSLLNRQSEHRLGQHRKMLSQLQEDLMWARMVPLSKVLNRFPRFIRDLSNTYGKPVNLTLQGTNLLVDKIIPEKLYDPLLHLLRNGFDHGIEPSEIRRAQGKPEAGQIEIRAYYKGRQVVMEVRDDGRGLDLDRIRQRVVALGWLSAEEIRHVRETDLHEFIFEPGFSTAAQVSELSGRGVGLDVVREQLRSLQGSVTVQSTPTQGTTFTLTLPLTLTIGNLLVCLVGTTPIAFRSDGITEILIPQPDQITQTGTQRSLTWHDQPAPIYRLSDILTYACLVPERPPSQVLAAVPAPANWEAPVLILQREQQVFALQVDRLVTEQELVIKPFGSAIGPPSYAYGCTVLGDGSLIPVIDGLALLEALLNRGFTAKPIAADSADRAALTSAMADPLAITPAQPSIRISQATTILVVDDSITSRRLLTLCLERAGYRVLQARDGQEALEQLQQSRSVQLVVCDIEMPNMNGFEFLTQQRQMPEFAAIPTVMLTSRSNDKHRWLALQLGATAYFTKPYLEQEFLTAIAEQITTVTKTA